MSVQDGLPRRTAVVMCVMEWLLWRACGCEGQQLVFIIWYQKSPVNRLSQQGPSKSAHIIVPSPGLRSIMSAAPSGAQGRREGPD